MLKRKAYSFLLNWKNSHSGKCLMVKGARQVGKTYLIRDFGKREYESFIEINFIKSKSLKTIFAGDLDADGIYKRMSLIMQDIRLVPGKTLIFLDEIQTCGNARTALKFLAEDGRFDIITSGSLLGLAYGEDDDPDAEIPESVPTGYEDFLVMHSLDFEEFLWALGYDETRVSALKDYFVSGERIPEEINRKYENLFREFMVVGGMPEVVADYVINKDFNRVDLIQKRILADYELDIGKHAKGAEKIKVRQCYDSIPKQLSKQLTKFQYSVVEKGQTRKKYGGSISWLVNSALVNQCQTVKEPFVPLSGNSRDDNFKLYCNDTGLLCCRYGFETKKALLLNTIKGSAKGGIYENVIAECLVKKGDSLYFFKPDNQHEIEFLVERDGQVMPIEVKSGNGITPSLNSFIADFKPSIAYKLIDGNIGISGCKKTIPHYFVLFI